MIPHPDNLQRLLRLARRAPRYRAPAPTHVPDEAEIRRLAQRALEAAKLSHQRRGEHESARANWAEAFERLCWWGAGATAAVCLLFGALHRPPPEPEGFELLLDWPAANTASTSELF